MNSKKPQFRLTKTITAHNAPLSCLSFNQQQTKFITASYDCSCRIFNADDGSKHTELHGHTEPVHCIEVDQSKEDLIASGSFDKTTKLWKPKSGICLATLKGHTQEVSCIAFGNNVVASGSLDNSCIIYDIQSQKQINKFKDNKSAITGIKFNKNILINASFDGIINFYDINSLQQIRQLSDNTNEILQMSIDPTGRYLSTLSGNSTCTLWDLNKLEQPLYCLKGHQLDLSAMTFDPTGASIVTGSQDGMAILYDVQTGKQIQKFKGHKSEIVKIIYSPNHEIITASTDKTVRIFTTDGVCHQVLDGQDDGLVSILCDQKCSTIVTASQSSSCQIWKL